MLTIPEFAFFALCRLAIPLPSPGPRCSSVHAGLPGHAVVAVRRAGDDALEHAEDAAHAGHAVERGDEMHLGGAGIGEAHFHPVHDERADETFQRRS